jgi:hypothetical protein
MNLNDKIQFSFLVPGHGLPSISNLRLIMATYWMNRAKDISHSVFSVVTLQKQ